MVGEAEEVAEVAVEEAEGRLAVADRAAAEDQVAGADQGGKSPEREREREIRMLAIRFN